MTRKQRHILIKRRKAVIKSMIYIAIVLFVADIIVGVSILISNINKVETIGTVSSITEATIPTISADVSKESEVVPLATEEEKESVIDYSRYASMATEEEISILSRAIKGEAGGTSYLQKCAVAWGILNRVDSTHNDFIQWDTLYEVVCSDRDSIQGYWDVEGEEIPDDCVNAAVDVLTRWYAEKDGVSVYRELPSNYLFWMGGGDVNYFTEEYHYKNREWARQHAYQF